MFKPLPFKELPRQVFETEFVSIHLLEAHDLLLLVWKRQINLEERKIGYGKALELTEEYQLKYWLIDDLQIYLIAPEEQQWVLTEFQEKASKTTIVKLGVITSDYYPALVANTEFTNKGKEGYQAKGVIQHEVFTDYESALNWLYPDESLEASSL